MSLRSQALGGAKFLMVREVLGIVVRTAGMLAVTRLIGPEQYGLFAGPYFVVQFLAVVALFGADTFVIRRQGDVEDRWFHQVFTFLLISGILIAALGILVTELFSESVSDQRFIAPMQVMLLSIPINILWVPARTRLERQFNYRRLAGGEIGADVSQYVVALLLAYLGMGFWAPVIGFLTRQTVLLVMSYALSGYRPRLHWDGAMLAEVLRFGGGVTGAALAVRARDLVLSIVVGRYLGAEGVGIAALAQRLADTAAFVNRVMLRLAMVALARMQNDRARLRAAVEEASALQVLAVGPVLVVLCVVGSVALPAVLGERWRDVVFLLPFLALSGLLTSLLSVPNTALIVTGRRLTVFLASAASLAIYFGAAFLLVPRMGLVGLGIAQVLSISAGWVRNLELRRSHGFRYRRALPWMLVTTPLLFAAMLGRFGWVALLPAVVVALSRRGRSEFMGHVTTVMSGGRLDRKDKGEDDR